MASYVFKCSRANVEWDLKGDVKTLNAQMKGDFKLIDERIKVVDERLKVMDDRTERMSRQLDHLVATTTMHPEKRNSERNVRPHEVSTDRQI
jgi:hypothetical protein